MILYAEVWFSFKVSVLKVREVRVRPWRARRCSLPRLCESSVGRGFGFLCSCLQAFDLLTIPLVPHFKAFSLFFMMSPSFLKLWGVQ